MTESKITLGIYKHYKGNMYQVLGVARHSENFETFVVYQALYGEFGIWVRPFSMFTENVEIDGKVLPRFHYVSEGVAKSSDVKKSI
ncbi:MAG: hypothetical protein RLZZ59_743 [Pseudomonadota bacterium]|jgi:hypothetical protein